jgi:hypothetical protein
MSTPDPEIQALRHRVTQLQGETVIWQHKMAELREDLAQTDRELREAIDGRTAWACCSVILLAILCALAATF